MEDDDLPYQRATNLQNFTGTTTAFVVTIEPARGTRDAKKRPLTPGPQPRPGHNAFDHRCRSCLALLTFTFGRCILATEMRSIFDVSLVRFAAVALVAVRTALPSYRGKFSKHVFSQLQPLAGRV